MWLSSTAQTALRAVLHLARQDPESLVPVEAIAEAIELPRNYLSKTLHTLRRAGVLRASRGPGGGFGLARPAAKIRLAEVIGPFAPATGRRCLLGRAHCGDSDPCPAHRQWSEVAGRTERFLAETTVADLATQRRR